VPDTSCPETGDRTMAAYILGCLANLILGIITGWALARIRN
jgi:hypothetical protein